MGRKHDGIEWWMAFVAPVSMLFALSACGTAMGWNAPPDQVDPPVVVLPPGVDPGQVVSQDCGPTTNLTSSNGAGRLGGRMGAGGWLVSAGQLADSLEQRLLLDPVDEKPLRGLADLEGLDLVVVGRPVVLAPRLETRTGAKNDIQGSRSTGGFIVDRVLGWDTYCCDTLLVSGEVIRECQWMPQPQLQGPQAVQHSDPLRARITQFRDRGSSPR